MGGTCVPGVRDRNGVGLFMSLEGGVYAGMPGRDGIGSARTDAAAGRGAGFLPRSCTADAAGTHPRRDLARSASAHTAHGVLRAGTDNGSTAKPGVRWYLL